MWQQHKFYFTFAGPKGDGIVEPSDSVWHWQVNKPDEDMVWDDAIYERVELEGWWGVQDTLEGAMRKVEEALQ